MLQINPDNFQAGGTCHLPTRLHLRLCWKV